jgi:hypothetical protein
VTIDGLRAAGVVDRVDLLLCDIQGEELAAVLGARSAIAAGAIRFAFISTHHESISGDPATHQRVRAAVESLGGWIIAEHSVAESFSGDGLVVASFDPRDRGRRVEVSYARARDSLFGEPEIGWARAVGFPDPSDEDFRRA